MKRDRLTESLTFLKENYVIALGSCYFFINNYVEDRIEHYVDSTYLYSLHKLNIPKLYNRFDVYLANKAEE